MFGNKFVFGLNLMCVNYTKIALIGSGGNINKIFKIAGVLDTRPLTLIKIKLYLQKTH